MAVPSVSCLIFLWLVFCGLFTVGRDDKRQYVVRELEIKFRLLTN